MTTEVGIKIKRQGIFQSKKRTARTTDIGLLCSTAGARLLATAQLAHAQYTAPSAVLGGHGPHPGLWSRPTPSQSAGWRVPFPPKLL